MVVSAARTRRFPQSLTSPKLFLRLALLLTLSVGLLSSKTANAQYFLRETPVGSWQAALAIPSFGNATTTVLLSFTGEGVVIETDTPTAGSFFFGSSALGNGHGAWKRTGRESFEYVYVKEIYAGTGAQGVALGEARSTAKAVLSADGNKLLISDVTVTFTAADGSVLASATGSGTATRITLEK